MSAGSSKPAEIKGFGLVGEIDRTCAIFGTKNDASSTASKTVPLGEKTLYRAEFLAQMPPAIHAFAAQRLASKKRRSMQLQRETDELSQEEREHKGRAGLGTDTVQSG